MNDMENMRVFADQLWKYMVPKLDSKFASNVSYFRAEVVSNPGNNKLEVQRPVENGTLTLPCVRAMSGAQAGQQVVALVMGSMSNAIIVGDGKLNVPGGGGDAGIANFQAQPDGSLVITLTDGTTFTATPVINAFANVQVGSTTITADNRADTLTLIAGGLVTLTGNATNDSVTISVDPNHTHITTQVLDLVNADSYGPSDLVTFDADVAEVPVKNCVVNIEALQAGSGDPSPTNIRAISGWDTVNVWRFAKNYFPQQDVRLGVGTGNVTVRFPRALPAGNYTLSADLASTYSGNCLVHILRSNGTYVERTGTPGSSVSVNFQSASGNEITGIRFYVGSNYSTSYNNSGAWSNIQVETGSTATAYEVPSVFAFSDLPETVYGGTMDVLKGTLTVKNAVLTVATAESTSYGTTSGGVPYLDVRIPAAQRSVPNGACVCSMYSQILQSQAGTSGKFRCYSDSITVYDSRFTGKANAESTLASDGFTVVYPLATPITYQLSPQIISTLLGNNNTWANCGTISIDYGAFLSALDKAIEEHSDDDIRHITETEREAWDGMLNHTHDASNIVSGILPAVRGGTGNGNGYIQIGKKAGTTLGDRATAEGINTTASGESAHAEGTQTVASGMRSHAEGYSTEATKSSAHAEGYNTTASGDASHAEGYGTTASGDESHAEGRDTVASGGYSHAEGFYTIAAGAYQHVFGKYNVSDESHVEIVGWGDSTTRKNIRTLSTTGNEWIAGTLTQASDARLKDVQGEIPDLSSIRAVRFRWKNGDDKEHLGYLAQDVEGIAPYLVGVDSNGYKSLDYIALLTAKVEMLEREIEKLKAGS